MKRDERSGATALQVSEALTIIYDDQCPACSLYCERLEFASEDVGELRRVSARSADPAVAAARAAGLNLDEGMAVLHRGKLYHGADALHHVAKLATGRGILSRLNQLLFARPALSRACYPVLRAARNTLLRVLGRAKIS